MVVLRDESPAPVPSIPQFFAGKAVFITGATGFMGKVLVERLLTTCPDVGRLYLLVRDKAGAKPEDRLLGLKRLQVFDGLRARNPAQLDKLRIVCGDITKPGLGITADALAELQEVGVVFNCAATVRFDEPLRVAAELNVLSVVRMLDLADTLPGIKAFVHVSTGYSNSERATIAERVYPLPSELQSMLASALAVPDHTPPEEIKRIISPKPNTYTYTKMLGEAALAQRARAYPRAICRPTIVTPALRHPAPGWTDSGNGPTAFILSVCKGVLHVFRVKKGCRADFMPVDIAIDMLIAVAWEIAIDNQKTVRVYNCSTNDNPTTFEQLREGTVDTARRHPLAYVAWYPSCLFIEQRILFETVKFFVQTVPFYLIEYLSRLFDHQKSRMNLIKLHSQLCGMNEVYMFFMSNEWTFCTDNVRRLRERLSRADAAAFNIDPRTIHWKKYYRQFVRGCCLHLAKDKEENLPQSRKRLQRMYLIHRTLTIVLPLLLLYQVLNPELLSALVQHAIRIANVILSSIVTVCDGFTHFLRVVRTWVHV